jgi:two-component system phosphate regulon response regulator PhoB
VFIETLHSMRVIRFSERECESGNLSLGSARIVETFPRPECHIPQLISKRTIVGSTRIVRIDEWPLIERLAALFERSESEARVARTSGDCVCEAQLLAPNLILLDLTGAAVHESEPQRQLRDGTGTSEAPILKLSHVKQRFSQRSVELPATRVERETSDNIVGKNVLAAPEQSAEPSTQGAVEPVLQIGPVRVDRHSHWAYLNETKLHLTPTEFRLLECFVREPGRALTRSQLMDMAIGNSSFVLERTIDVHIRSLRTKLGAARELIETVRGIGYRFRESSEPR